MYANFKKDTEAKKVRLWKGRRLKVASQDVGRHGDAVERSRAAVGLELDLRGLLEGGVVEPQVHAPCPAVPTWDRCYDFKNIIAEKFADEIEILK
jgi:hypothetical protein